MRESVEPSCATTQREQRDQPPVDLPAEESAGPTFEKLRRVPPSEWTAFPVIPLPVEQFTELPPVAVGYVRFVHISDTHGKHEGMGPLPPGDVLIHTGDFTNSGTVSEVRSFCEWFGKQPHAQKLLIAGNHDLTLHRGSFEQTSVSWGVAVADGREACATARQLVHSIEGCEYLCDSDAVVKGGVTVWGAPWQPRFAGAFNLRRGKALRERWRRIPVGTDVVLTHGPPLGHGDWAHGARGRANGERTGCFDLLEELRERVKPVFHCFGHIHEAHGATTDGTTIFLNAAACTRRGQISQAPLVFDVRARTTGAHL